MKAEYIDHMGSDLMVANCARVSFAKWKMDFDDSDDKLIKYLAIHDHISPFFHPQIQIRITAPIFVANQAKRHQIGFAINEVSRRYVDDEPQCWAPSSWRKRPYKSIKQGSGDEITDIKTRTDCDEAYQQAVDVALDVYEYLLSKNVSPEMARAVLPQSMYTQWIWTGSLFAYARLCRQRLDAHAQKEIQGLAQHISAIIAPLYPVSWAALMRVGDE